MFNRKIGTISKTIHTPYEGMFGLGGGTPTYVKEVTGTRYIDLTNAVANKLLELKAYGGTEQRNLPNGYTQVEYLTLDGDQYLLTDYYPSSNTELDIKYYPAVSSRFMCIYGVQDSTSANRFYGLVSSTQYRLQMNYSNQGSGFWGFNNDGTYTQGTSNGTFTSYQEIVSLAIKKDLVSITSNSLGGTINYDMTNDNIWGVDVNCTYPLMIGSRSTAGVEGNNFIGNLYQTTIKENNVVLRNYIPCRRNSDSVLGMYDTVTDNFFTNAGTGTFTAGADATPTPDTPMDIISNNGVLKVRHQSGLPFGYALLEYIESSGTQYINTGITDITNSEFEVVAQQTSITGSFPTIMGAMDRTSDYKVICGLSTSNNSFYSQCGGAMGYIVSSVPNDTQKHSFKVTTTTNQQTLQVDDTASIIGNYQITSTTDYSLTIGARNKSEVSNFTRQKVFSVRIKKSGTLVCNLIPARRNSDNELGMYDTVTGTFFTNQGTGDFTAGQNINDLEIYTDGTTETITDELGNTATAETLLKVDDYKDTQEILSGNITRNVGIKVFDGSEEWYESSLTAVIRGATEAWGAVPGVNGFCTHLDVLQSGEAIFAGACRFASDFNVYYYKDTFGVNSISEFKQYLANQYNAGAPVIIVYPLATPTTESVAGQTMNIQTGNNTIEITQASIDNLQLYAKYKSSQQ